jgi:hypothetical protein
MVEKVREELPRHNNKSLTTTAQGQVLAGPTFGAPLLEFEPHALAETTEGEP